MTLATHAIVGAAFAELFPTHPIGAFAAGFASHLAIDSLPHWDYLPLSLRKDKERPLETDMVVGKNFLKDSLKIGLDALIGMIIAISIFNYFFHTAPLSITTIGAIAGILPDPLQFVYYKTRSQLLLPLQRFHVWVQKGKSLDVKPWIGVSLQLVLVIIICTVILLFKKNSL